jgi:hypothetical protein
MKCTYLTFEDPMHPVVHLREFLPDCCSTVHQCRTRRTRRTRREEAASEDVENKGKMKIKKRIVFSF